MTLPVKTYFLNFFRNIFKIEILETRLVKLTQGKSTSHFFSKLIPNHYQYPTGTFRLVRQRGVSLKVDIGDYIGHCLYYAFDGTESKSYEKLFSLCKPGAYVVDIGANIGYTSLVMSSLVGNGKVAAFEPDPVNFQQAGENISRNEGARVDLYNVALGNRKGVAFLEERLPTCRGANRIAVTTNSGIPVSVERMDDFFPSLNFPRVDLMKIDVEGYELYILMGGKSILKEFEPVLFIEVDNNNLKDQGHSAAELVDFLCTLGYNEFTVAETGMTISATTDFKDCHFDLIARVKTRT
jgi:FkbM family methyltransferase